MYSQSFGEGRNPPRYLGKVHQSPELLRGEGENGRTFLFTPLQSPEVAEPSLLGTELSVGEECGTVESVKSASDVFSPLSGVVAGKNEAVEEDPALVSRSPEDEGWLFRIDIADVTQLEGLMDHDSYQAFLTASKEEEEE